MTTWKEQELAVTVTTNLGIESSYQPVLSYDL
jgi:hypothetical protein